jgi:5-(carboxyamino)imidazole ribonucleotide mutase
MGKQVLVGIALGSDSDLAVMREASDILKDFKIEHELVIVSAHRTPEDMSEYSRTAQSRGLKVIIAGAGGAAHLPGMLAAYTTLPVIGVPVPSKHLSGLDSLYSIVQMPPGIPVATGAIGAGKNAGILAVQILAIHDKSLAKKLAAFRLQQSQQSRAKNKKI